MITTAATVALKADPLVEERTGEVDGPKAGAAMVTRPAELMNRPPIA